MNRTHFIGCLLGMLGLSLVVACQGAADSDQTFGHLDDWTDQSVSLELDHESTLSFRADGNQILSNPPLFAGGRLRVEYDPNRLAGCRGSHAGAWSIIVHLREKPSGTLTSRVMGSSGNLLSSTFAVGEEAEWLEIWFENTDDQGCRDFDNRSGANYQFQTVVPTGLSRVLFPADWNESAQPAIVAGGLMQLDYDPARLRLCRATYNGGRTWNILAHWAFSPGGQRSSIPLFAGDYYAGEEAILRPLLTVPEDAESVEVWFVNSDRAGCVAWDSNLGDNYRFPVASSAEAVTEIGWVGEHDFVIAYPNETEHLGKQDPVWYQDNWAGMPKSSWTEIQIWVQGLTDVVYANTQEAAQAAAARLDAGVLTSALAEEWPLEFVEQRGNNFVYAFRFWKMRYVIYNDPPVAAGLYQFRYRFTLDGQAAQEFGRADGQDWRFVVSPDLDCSLFPDGGPEGCQQSTSVDWAGNWGGRFDHSCSHRLGLDEPVVFTKSSLGHDCMVISAEVYVAGLTDAGGDPQAIMAQVESDIGFGGGPLVQPVTYDLAYDTRSGNNYRYQWFCNEHVGRSDRGDYRFRFRFSADQGQTWSVIGDEAGGFRALWVRNDSTDVEAQQFCEGLESWQSAFQHQDACIDYQPATQVDTNNCEFYVNAFGRGQWSQASVHASWLESWISVNAEQEGQVENVGLWASYRDLADGSLHEVLSLGSEYEPNYWLVGLTKEENSLFDRQVEALAFFLDVRRLDGSVERLWQSRSGANYTEADIFAVAGFLLSLGSGSVEYADESMGLFDAKRACAQ